MPIRTHCPSCNTKLTVADRLLGKKVKCQSCQESFVVEEDLGADAGPLAREAVRTERPSKPPPLRRPRADDDEEQDEEPRGRRGRRRDEDDEEDDRRGRGRRRRQASGPSGVAIALIVGGSLAGLIIVGLVLFLLLRSSAPIAPGNMAGVGVPGIPGAPGGIAPIKEDIIQPAGQRLALNIKDSQVRDLVTNGPANTRAAAYLWETAGKLKHLVAIYDVGAGQEAGRFEVPEPQQLDLSPDGTRLASVSQQVENGKLVKRLGIWSLPDGKPVVQGWEPYPQEQDFAKRRDLLWAYLLSSSQVLTVTQQGQCDVWEVPGKQRLAGMASEGPNLFLTTNGFGHTATHFAISPDRKTLAIFNKEGFTFMDTASGKVAGKTASLANEGLWQNQWGVSFSPDGKTLAAYFFVSRQGAQQAGVLARWSVPDGQRQSLALLPAEIGFNGDLAFWGTSHVILWDGNLFKGKIYDPVKGVGGRICEKRGFAKFVAQSYDAKVWGATPEIQGGLAFLSNVDFPQADLTQFPPQANPQRTWVLTPAGLTPAQGR